MNLENRRVICFGDTLAELTGLLDRSWQTICLTESGDGEVQAADSGAGVGVVRLNSAEEHYLRKVEDCLLRFNSLNWVALVDSRLIDDETMAGFICRNFFDYHTLPVDPGRFVQCIGHACGMAALKRRVAFCRTAEGEHNQSIIGKSAVMLELFKQTSKVARTESSVLITGESGTGKELVAREIHRRSARYDAPFVAVNCGSLPEKLIQSELFGHEKGAFTGAIARKKGKIEAASGGTIFLDEIGDLPYEAQVNLLRFLQEGTIERVGGTEEIKVDVRVIAATHVDLDRAIEEGRFREDLYFRLNVLNLQIPPLRDRGDDIQNMANVFFERYAGKNGGALRGFSKQAIAVMRNHPWPGNVRELMNRVQRACVMAEGRVITPADLDLDNRCSARSRLTLDTARRRAEKSVIRDALYHSNHNIAQASRILGVSRVTLYRLLDKHQLVNLHTAS